MRAHARMIYENFRAEELMLCWARCKGKCIWSEEG